MSVSTLSLTRYEAALAAWRSKYDQGRGQLTLLTSQREQKATLLTQTNASMILWRQTQMLLTKVSDYARRQLVERIEQTVTAALQAVFADPAVRFVIEIGERNKQSTAEWTVITRCGELEAQIEPEDGDGGGLCDVVSLALRLALLELARPKPEGIVVFDEPGKMISAQHSANLAAFLKAYAMRTGRQILMISHNATLAMSGDLIWWVDRIEGMSEAKRITPDELAERLERLREQEERERDEREHGVSEVTRR